MAALGHSGIPNDPNAVHQPAPPNYGQPQLYYPFSGQPVFPEQQPIYVVQPPPVPNPTPVPQQPAPEQPSPEGSWIFVPKGSSFKLL